MLDLGNCTSAGRRAGVRLKSCLAVEIYLLTVRYKCNWLLLIYIENRRTLLHWKCARCGWLFNRNAYFCHIFFKFFSLLKAGCPEAAHVCGKRHQSKDWWSFAKRKMSPTAVGYKLISWKSIIIVWFTSIRDVKLIVWINLISKTIDTFIERIMHVRWADGISSSSCLHFFELTEMMQKQYSPSSAWDLSFTLEYPTESTWIIAQHCPLDVFTSTICCFSTVQHLFCHFQNLHVKLMFSVCFSFKTYCTILFFFFFTLISSWFLTHCTQFPSVEEPIVANSPGV